jgi:hypothetical protein
MKKKVRIVVCCLAVLVLFVGGAGSLAADPAASEAAQLCGIWVNTAYNGGPQPAILVWAQDGMLTCYDESSDTRCIGCSCCTVRERWSQEGATYFSVASVTSFLGGVELRAATHLYRLSADGNVLERIGVFAGPAEHAASKEIQATDYLLFYRQGPNGLTPGQAKAGPTG